MAQHLKTILDLGNEGMLINMPDGINPQDAATVNQVGLLLGVIGEVVTGAVDNVNTIFTTAFNFALNTTRVYYNGVRQDRGAFNDYFEAGPNQIVFNTAPKKGKVTIDYIKA